LAKKSCYALTFGDDDRLPGLQAADMVAFCSRAEHLQHAFPLDPIVEELIGILWTSDRKSGQLIYRSDGAGLGHGEIEIVP
jgi:hypothetical protein